jgi:hypothetical protein
MNRNAADWIPAATAVVFGLQIAAAFAADPPEGVPASHRRFEELLAKRAAEGDKGPPRVPDPGLQVLHCSDRAIQEAGGISALERSNVPGTRYICENAASGRAIIAWREWACSEYAASNVRGCVIRAWPGGYPAENSGDVPLDATGYLMAMGGTSTVSVISSAGGVETVVAEISAPTWYPSDPAIDPTNCYSSENCLAKYLRSVNQMWHRPDNTRCMALTAELSPTLDDDIRINGARVIRASGNDEFDTSAIAAVTAAVFPELVLPGVDGYSALLVRFRMLDQFVVRFPFEGDNPCDGPTPANPAAKPKNPG